MKKFKKYQLLILLLFILFVAFKTYRFFQIDSCLDSGGKWDYKKNECTNSIE
ncbi:hypothetical protein SAMN05444395_11529 [Flavobacterium fryxellicola]|nr:hypothetical protein SAMN05444395_11529 [Flavobacterium fryxellicola]